MSYYLEIQSGARRNQVPFVIFDKEDSHGTHYSHFGVGGYMELPTLDYRNSIPTGLLIGTDGFSSGRRKVGMIVYVISENKYYQLIPTENGQPISLDRWLFLRPAKKLVLLNPELQGIDDFDDGSVADENGDFDWASFDILSGSGNPNDCWTEVFVKGNFNTLPELQAYIESNTSAYAGQICSVIEDKKVYLVINSVDGETLSLQEIGVGGGAGSSEIFEEDITVSIEQGKTFGKYKNGDVIPSTGKTANEVIKMACLEALPPDTSISSSSSVLFGAVDVSIVLNFSYVIKSLGAEISQLKIERKRGNESSWVTIVDDSSASSPLSDNFVQTQYDTSLINYRYTVSDSAGGTKTITYNVTPASYAAPSISSINVGSESRYRGDSATTYTATIIKNSPLISLSSYKLQRSINSGTWTDVGPSVNISGDPSSVSVNLTEASSSDSNLKNADSIKYRISVTDSYSSNNLTERTINFYHKCGIIYKSSNLTLSDIDSASGLVLQDAKARTITGVTASGGNYTYYVYKSSAGNLTNVIQNDSLPVLGAFTKQADLNGTNSNGSSVDYAIYRSNSTNAFTGAKLAFS